MRRLDRSGSPSRKDLRPSGAMAPHRARRASGGMSGTAPSTRSASANIRSGALIDSRAPAARANALCAFWRVLRRSLLRWKARALASAIASRRYSR